MTETSALSPEKQYLLTLSDEAIRLLIRTAQKSMKKNRTATDSCSVVLPSSSMRRLERLRQMPDPVKSKEDSQWQDYTEEMLKLHVRIPDYYQKITDRQMYTSLTKACAENLLPASFAEMMIPCIMEYVRTGHMTPLILTGTPGCGKTTAAKILAEIIGLEYTLIDAPSADTNHGLGGDSSAFVGSDIGMVVRSQLNHHCLNPVLIIEEVEKAPHPYNRASLQDELLSLCDGSADRFTDNYLTYPVNASYCPIILTCNDIDSVSAPLRDRSCVFEFPDVDEERMEKMMTSYYSRQSAEKYPDMFDLDTSDLMQAVSVLYNCNIHSIRQHQKLVDGILRDAYLASLNEAEGSRYLISGDLIRKRLNYMTGNRPRKIGFC